MKLVFSFLLSSLLATNTFAQSNTYTGKDSSATYVPLTNGTPFNFDDTLDIGFDFKYFDTITTKFTVDEMGLFFTDTTFDASLSLFLGQDYYYFQGPNTILSYQRFGTSPNQKLVIESKNLVIDSNDVILNDKTISYQMNLYENGTLELHIGPHTLQNFVNPIAIPAFIEQYSIDTAWLFYDSIQHPKFRGFSLDSLTDLEDPNDFPHLSAIPETGRLYQWNNTYPNRVTTGISPFNKSASSIRIYPNPTTGLLRISSTNASPNQTVLVYNHLGQFVLRSTEQVLDLIDVPEGLYFVHIINGQTRSTHKVIVQH